MHEQVTNCDYSFYVGFFCALTLGTKTILGCIQPGWNAFSKFIQKGLMHSSCQTAVKLKENVFLQLLGLFGFLGFFKREGDNIYGLCFVLSFFPPLSLGGIPKKEVVLCAVGLVPFYYVSVSLDENLKLCVAQVALIKRKKPCLKSLKLVRVSYFLCSAFWMFWSKSGEKKKSKKNYYFFPRGGKEF